MIDFFLGFFSFSFGQSTTFFAFVLPPTAARIPMVALSPTKGNVDHLDAKPGCNVHQN